jgi:tetratricopeptide (TPR) repeat protein
MIFLSLRRNYLILVFAFLFIAFTANPSSAERRVIDEVRFDESQEFSEIHIQFNQLLRYISHAPEENGSKLLIQMQVVSTVGLDLEQFRRRETHSLKPTDRIPLWEVVYEENHLGWPNIILSFNRGVHFQVRGSSDFRSVVITIQPEIKEAVDLQPPVLLPDELTPVPPVEEKIVAPPVKRKEIPEERLQLLVDEAEKAMTGGDYRRAIQLYTRILQSTDEKRQQEAQEFLGLARERNNQLAHAKAEYEKYLELYPEGEGAVRVRQRLAGLLTARAKPKDKLRKSKTEEALGKWKKDFYGSLAMFYNKAESFTDQDEQILDINFLTTDLDFTTRFQSENFDVRTLFVGGYGREFSEESDDESYLSSLYLDLMDNRLNLFGRFGRQSGVSDGVLGRFDGAKVSWHLFSTIKINGVAGFPVETSTNIDIDSDIYFYGLSLDLGSFANHWDVNAYIINQELDSGITDRRAVGGEVRYADSSKSFFSLIDYDIFYNDLNIILLTGNLIFKNRSTINFSAEYRNSPILTTSNALQGQGVETITELLDNLTEDEITGLAEDRTGSSKTFLVGGTNPITEKLQINWDLTATTFGGTIASGGVEANPDNGYDFFYFVQLLGSDLIKEGDIAILGARYSDTSSSDTISLSLNTRYPVRREWRFNPRVQVDFRKNKSDSSKLFKVRPSLRMEYWWKRRISFEIEGGGEWSSDTSSDRTDRTKGYFVTAGFRFDF